jgi:hypothetical protein
MATASGAFSAGELQADIERIKIVSIVFFIVFLFFLI